MKSLLSVALLLAVAAANAVTTTLDFEDFAPGFPTITTYGGFDFDPGAMVIKGFLTGTDYAAHSGTGMVTSQNSVLAATLISGTATDFSAWYTAPYANSSEEQRPTLDLYLGSTLVATTGGLAQVYKTTAQISFAGIEFDRFVMSNPSTGGAYFGLDDISYTTQAVPEPASMAALGLGGLALFRRRRA